MTHDRSASGLSTLREDSGLKLAFVCVCVCVDVEAEPFSLVQFLYCSSHSCLTKAESVSARTGSKTAWTSALPARAKSQWHLQDMVLADVRSAARPSTEPTGFALTLWLTVWDCSLG